MPGWFAWTGNESSLNCIHLSFSDCLSLGAFSFANAASRIKPFIPLINWHFCSWLPCKHCMKSPLHCKHSSRLLKSQHVFSFLDLWCHFYNCMCNSSGERFGNWRGTNYKIDHVTYSDAFSFHSCAFLHLALQRGQHGIESREREYNLEVIEHTTYKYGYLYN